MALALVKKCNAVAGRFSRALWGFPRNTATALNSFERSRHSCMSLPCGNVPRISQSPGGIIKGLPSEASINNALKPLKPAAALFVHDCFACQARPEPERVNRRLRPVATSVPTDVCCVLCCGSRGEKIAGIKKPGDAGFSITQTQSYLLMLRAPKRDLKRSIRPPESTIFCLPV